MDEGEEDSDTTDDNGLTLERVDEVERRDVAAVRVEVEVEGASDDLVAVRGEEEGEEEGDDFTVAASLLLLTEADEDLDNT